MTTAEIINQFNANVGSERVIVVNGTPDNEEKVMDLTVETKKPRKKKEVVLKPEDNEKVVHEVLPHFRVVSYSKGYQCPQVKKGKSWFGAPMYQEELQAVIDKLTELLPHTLEYGETNN
jgi:hypothetical protein